MRTGRKWGLAGAASAVALVMSAAPASAQQTPDTAELLKLVKQQAKQLAELQARLDKLEAQQQTASAASAPAPSPVPQTAQQTQQADVDAQVQNAIQDSKTSELASLQAQVAQLAANNKRGVDVRWRNGGPEFRSSNGFFTFRPRGDFLLDFSTTSGSRYDDRNLTGTEVRDIRLGAQGNVGKVGYKVDVGFEDNSVHVKEAYISYDFFKSGPRAAELFLGQKLEDRSIDGSTTKRRLPFMERNAASAVGAPDIGYFNLGPQFKLYGPTWHVSVSFSGDSIGNGGDYSDSYAVFGRAHWNPIKGQGGFVHVGLWGWAERLAADADSINEVPHLVQHFNDNIRVSATRIDGTVGDHAWGGELGGVFHNLYAFGEYANRYISATDDPSAHQVGYSVYGGWFITGERPGFSTRSGIWGTTKVNDPVTDGGHGAISLNGRYDKYDFTDSPRGGWGDSWTLGVNWYLNNWARLMLNYVHWRTDNHVGSYKGRDTGDSIGVRSQISF